LHPSELQTAFICSKQPISRLNIFTPQKIFCLVAKQKVFSFKIFEKNTVNWHMINNSISLKVSRNSILYINFPEVFLRIAKLCKQTTATIGAKLEISIKCNGVFKQWNLF